VAVFERASAGTARNKRLKLARALVSPLGRALAGTGQAAVLVVLLLLVGRSSEIPRRPCLPYRPAAVTLEGTLLRRTYPRPPTHEDLRRGDQPDSVLILRIPAPICVAPDAASDEGDKHLESDVRELQLAIGTDSLWAQLRAAHSSHLRVTGELFHAIAGHPRTRVLMWVIQIRAA
jgi:hypothetical protein